MPPKYEPRHLPRLNDYDGDLTKRWYIEYFIWHADKRSFIRRRYWGMNKYTTLAARRKVSKQKVDEIAEVLQQGYTAGEGVASVSPYDLKQLTIKEAYNFFVNTKNAADVEGDAFRFNEQYNPGSEISEDTYKNFKGSRKLFFEWLDKMRLSNVRLIDFTPSSANAFCDYLKKEKRYANKTFNNVLSDLRNFYGFFIHRDDDFPGRNPFLKVKKKKVAQSASHVPFSNEQLEMIRQRVIDKGDVQLYLFISFIYYTFARPGTELRLLQVKDIRRTTIYIPDERAKTEGAHIEIPPALERMIQEYRLRSYPADHYVFTAAQRPGPTPIGKAYMYKRHAKLLKELGLTDRAYTIYGYKHTGAINLYLATKDIKLVQRHCRHTTSVQTDEYLRELGVLLSKDGLPEF